ncbi:MAG: ATP-binding protein [Armatimonadetes bacterium]|nr:ATP-binding protein [Armatimonadota bacterium]
MKLDSGVSPEALRAGQYVVLDGDAHLFYTMIDDVRLLSASPKIPVRPPGEGDELLREVLRGESTYVTVHLRPLLQIPRDDDALGLDSAQVKTVPSHFTAAWRASEEDVQRVFGDRDAEGRFHVGQPLDMNTPICLDLQRLVERSNGIFGKTGTGKTFLTRLVLCGLMHKCAGEVVTLVFDMHNEYGNRSRQEGSNVQVRGLRELFPGQVKVYTLDRKSTERRQGHWDDEIQLAYADIQPADLFAMRQELDLSEAGCDTLNLLAEAFGEQWLSRLFVADPDELATEIGAHAGALAAARRKLSRLKRLTFLQATLPETARRSFESLVDRLSAGTHVVLEFGNVTSLTAYLLVANVLTRKLHARWVEKAETYHATQQPADRPPQLVICVEEAHKFLNPEAARQTSFGQIARELRKYFVSLLVVDQRPSGIDDEILSQLGTRITAQLNDDRDIQAVLAGTTNAAGLRVVLAGLDSKQQALVFGHAVPMPVVLRTRSFDEQVYQEVRGEAVPRLVDVDQTVKRPDPPNNRTGW